MPYNIKLTFETPVREKFRGRDRFRLRVTASDAVGMPNEIFLANRELLDPENPTGDTKVMFQSICSVIDLDQYPINAIQTGQWPPFFRVAVIDIPLPSLDTCDYVIDQTKQQVASLIKQHNDLDKMVVADEVWIPGPPT
jgi:hypothetical protein